MKLLIDKSSLTALKCCHGRAGPLPEQVFEQPLAAPCDGEAHDVTRQKATFTPRAAAMAESLRKRVADVLLTGTPPPYCEEVGVTDEVLRKLTYCTLTVPPMTPERRWLDWMLAAWATPHPLHEYSPQLRESLLSAIQSGESPDERIIDKHQLFVARMRAMADSMLQEQADWASKLEPYVRRLIGDVHMPLLSRLAAVAGYWDHNLASDSAGFHICGDVKASGAWEPHDEGSPAKTIAEVQMDYHPGE